MICEMPLPCGILPIRPIIIGGSWLYHNQPQPIEYWHWSTGIYEDNIACSYNLLICIKPVIVGDLNSFRSCVAA